jgi:hypothetical protein
MAFNNYNIDQERYLDVLKEKTTLGLLAFGTFLHVAEEHGIDLKAFTDKFIWDFFQEVVYTTEDECRQIQKKENPKAVQNEYEFLGVTTKEEILLEIKQLKELVSKEKA